MNTIIVKHGLFDVKLTQAEVEHLLTDVKFLEECAYMLVNPKAVSDSDIPFTNEQRMNMLKEYCYGKKDVSKDFLDKVFSKPIIL